MLMQEGGECRILGAKNHAANCPSSIVFLNWTLYCVSELVLSYGHGEQISVFFHEISDDLCTDW
ncbi:protein of unknown function (plasmid) [Legionella fallonii LLAP-10]|uniref:Uncharacterized protein n=1 Tax=Legionella fallonii LLAP-10 TaxID=1212491 RepID=A0A098G9G8_9GAMM|nr:protein of unknown function [Legionella fallonii LLAP-10]